VIYLCCKKDNAGENQGVFNMNIYSYDNKILLRGAEDVKRF